MIEFQDHLTIDKKMKLQDICDEDGFVEEINRIIDWELFRHLGDPKIEVADGWKRFLKNRRVSKRPVDVRREIKQTRDQFEKLSPQALIHIFSNCENGLDDYYAIMDALKKPYVGKEGNRPGRKRNPNRESYINSLLEVCNEYHIDTDPSQSGELFELVTFIKEITNSPYHPARIVRDIAIIAKRHSR